MPNYTVWMVDKNNVSVSGGGSLDGVTQGTGTHLVGQTITINTASYRQTTVFDDDLNFDDNDTGTGGTGQRLSGAQNINGVNYADGTRVEAEYRLILTDPVTGRTYTAVGYNVTNSNPSYATIEGLTFQGDWPPVGRPLTVTSATEGSGNGQPVLPYSGFTPPCFTPGTLIATQAGLRAVETLNPGDRVLTRDNGLQPVRAVLRTSLSAGDLLMRPQLAPVLLPAGCLKGLDSALIVSPQHRVLLSGARAELLFGESELLVPAVALCGRHGAQQLPAAQGVTYLHLLFDQHQIVWSNGLLTESFQADSDRAGGFGPAVQAELAQLFGPDAAGRRLDACRPTLSRREAAVLLDA
jgi:hypothetical protein